MGSSLVSNLCLVIIGISVQETGGGLIPQILFDDNGPRKEL